MKDFKIDGRLIRAFVLTETAERIVYIPLKSIHKVDYDRLKKMEKEKPAKMSLLDYMKKTTLDNGRNALVQYDSLIQVAQFKAPNAAVRLVKPEEAENAFKAAVAVADAAKQEVSSTVGVHPVPTLDENTIVSNTGSTGIEPEYHFVDNHGKKRIWSGKGRVPDVIKEHVENGGDIEDFRKV